MYDISEKTNYQQPGRAKVAVRLLINLKGVSQNINIDGNHFL